MQEFLGGSKAFVWVWLGQVISLLGSAMTWFALMVWAYEQTGQATALALLGFFSFGPTLLLGPVAGALVDRWNRKLVLVLSDLSAGLATLAVLALYASGTLQVWHLYVIGFLAGAFQAFEYPAYAAAVTMMVPKDQYARASGMLELAWSASSVVAPVLAGMLLGRIGIAGIMTIDVITFVIAIGALLFVAIPEPTRSAAGSEGQGSLWKESLYGFRYVWERPSLLGFQLLLAVGNLADYAAFILFAPMILARSGSDELALGSVQSAIAVGGVAGGVLLSVWGGPKRRIHGVLIGWSLSGVGILLMGLGSAVPLWLLAGLIYGFLEPIVNGSVQAIWQVKVAPDVQGRVFSTQLLMSQATMPLAMLLAGPLADQIFEPAMMSGGSLAEAFGWLVGTAPGAGMALLIALCGGAVLLLPLLGYAIPAVRDIEELVPDYDGCMAETSA